MSKLTLVVKDDDALGFLHVYPEGNIHTQEDLDEMFQQILSTTPGYSNRESWDKPDLVGAIKGHVNWFRPHDKAEPPKTYNILPRKKEVR
jgi:hypothetical protein|tara:strand:+ start:482 stop:751 length:270 start_codon:yes stop_codon:yes gene_type:complete